MSADKRYGDERDEPLDFPTTRENPSVDEEKEGFQNVEGPGARRGERAISSTNGSPEGRAVDAGVEDLENEDLDEGSGVDSATTGSPLAPTTGTGAGKQRGDR